MLISLYKRCRTTRNELWVLGSFINTTRPQGVTKYQCHNFLLSDNGRRVWKAAKQRRHTATMQIVRAFRLDDLRLICVSRWWRWVMLSALRLPITRQNLPLDRHGRNVSKGPAFASNGAARYWFSTKVALPSPPGRSESMAGLMMGEARHLSFWI